MPSPFTHRIRADIPGQRERGVVRTVCGFGEDYAYPYHWIPHAEAGRWRLSRALGWGHEYLAVLETMRGLALRLRPTRVLDFGCGDGRLAWELLEAGVPEVVGVDIVEQAVAFARAFNLGHGDRGRFVAVPLQDLDDRNFDVAIAMETFEHIPEGELRAIVRGLWERLREGGTLLVSVPTGNKRLNSKDERHYTEGLLASHLAPWFVIGEARYVHRMGMTERVVRKVLVSPSRTRAVAAAARWITRLYRRRVWRADRETGGHLFAVCSRTVKPDREP